MKNVVNRNPRCRDRQKGAITMFSAVLILILLTEMVFYAVQVGVFEQRKSSNEMNQKLAFHTADGAIQQAKQYLAINAVLASKSDLAGGWLVAGSERWSPCAAADLSSKTHPCWGEPVDALRAGTYFYDFGGSDELPLDPDVFSTGVNEKVTMHALLCMLEVDRSLDPVVQGCTTNATLQDDRYFMITLLARGEADCDNSSNNCGAEALISEKIGSFGPGGGEGGPGVPLTARTVVPLSGTVEIVPNPNGGGLGVPISTWANANTACGGVADPVSPDSGSYSTCERHEFYGLAEFPADYKCPGNNCSCSKNDDRLLSYAQGNDRQLGMDIVPDVNFPCDLWTYMFGYSKAEYLKVKNQVPKQNRLTDCSTLDINSVGYYWISGNTCNIQDQIGTKDGPVFLISAAADTRINAGAEIFGVLFVTDVEEPGAEFTGNGRGTIYGAAVMDAVMEHFNGTFQIVYLETVINTAVESGATGAVAGGWTDFHASWQ